MTAGYVFDTEAVMAFLYDEPGHEAVATHLGAVFDGDADGSIAGTNAAEVFYLVARFEGTAADEPTPASLRIADRDVRALERQGLHVRRADWRIVGEVKAHGGLSLADAAAVGLAHERDATLVAGGDDDFEDLPVPVEVTRFRSGST